MKKYLLGLIVIIMCFGCSNKDYDGYWCKYQETGTIVVLLDNASDKAKTTINQTIESLEGLQNYDFVSKEDFKSNLDDSSNIEVYDTYFIYFDSINAIDDNIIKLSSLEGVKSATKNNIKSNVTLYHLDNNKYTLKNTTDKTSDNEEEGKFSIKDNEITLNSNGTISTLFIKDEYLCSDESCNTIYRKSNELCE